MKPFLPALTLAFALTPMLTSAQTASPLAARFADVLQRAGSGHAPTPEDLAATADPSQPIPDAPDISAAMPLILKAVDHTDPEVRMYALLTLQSFRSGESPVYKGPVAKALTPGIPKIAAHLTDENQTNRLLTTAILGGFTPDPPSTVYPPLIAYLRRDDAVDPVGLAVVEDLLGLGPVPDDASAAVVKYLRRADQTSDSRSNLIDAIASQPRQSLAVNAQLLTWLDSDDASVRARLILSLPQLELSPESYSDTRARIAAVAQNDSENLQVVTAARSIVPCWTSIHMTTPCPVYDTGDKPATPKPQG